VLLLLYFSAVFNQILGNENGIMNYIVLEAYRGNWNSTFILNATYNLLQATNDRINNQQAQENYLTAPYLLGLNDIGTYAGSAPYSIITDLALLLILFFWYFVSCLVVAVSEWVYRKTVY